MRTTLAVMFEQRFDGGSDRIIVLVCVLVQKNDCIDVLVCSEKNDRIDVLACALAAIVSI